MRARSGTNPTYAAFDAATSTAYFTNENLEDGCIKSFRLSSDGKLAALNSQPVEGNHPCYLAADSSAVLTASYVSGHVHIFPTGPDGSLEAGSTPRPPSVPRDPCRCLAALPAHARSSPPSVCFS